MGPEFSFRIYAADYCFLDLSKHFFIILEYGLKSDIPITVDAKDSVLDPAAAFTKRYLDITDTDTGEQVDFSPSREGHELMTQETSRLVVLGPETQENYIIWET